jgi:hypothetical protein
VPNVDAGGISRDCLDTEHGDLQQALPQRPQISFLEVATGLETPPLPATRAAASKRQNAFHGFCLGMTVLQWFLRLAAGRSAAMQCLPAQRCPASAR